MQKLCLYSTLVCILIVLPAKADPTCSGSGCSVNQDAPVWSQIMIANDNVTQVAYFKYTNVAGGIVETAFNDTYMAGSSSLDSLLFSPRPTITYLFSDVATSANGNGTFEYGTSGQLRSVCGGSQSTNLGDYSVFSASGGLPSTSGPGEFNVSRQESGIKGISIQGAFDGSVLSGLGPQGSATETFFFTDQECTFGGHEYGFFRDAVASPAGTAVFYVSDHTNCVDNGCNPSDAVLGQRTSTFTIPNLSNNVNGGSTQWYSAYFIAASSAPNGYIIRVQIVDPITLGLESCGNISIAGDGSVTQVVTDPLAATGPCTFDVTPPSWYRADLVNGGSGYLYGGFQLGGNPDTVGNTPAVFMETYKVGK